jgi:tetratricopeptide (TPR) repeat protein/MinD-like ATPase involved in chromosome partitioning or flagellar assembly
MDRKGKIITFYSYKGGVGRSFLLANVAVTLAKWGFRVLCADWDLEAPGLRDYFKPHSTTDGRGIVDFMEDLAGGLRPNWLSFVTDVAIESTTISMMWAGSTDRYTERAQALSWDALYESYDLGDELEKLRLEASQEFDIVLIDSRTGVSDIGGICTVQLPDAVVMVYTANNQSLEGTLEVGKRIEAARNRLPYDRMAAPVLPILSRFDSREETDLARHWREQAASKLAPLWTQWLPDDADVLALVEATAVPHIARWSFGEGLPALTERATSPDSIAWTIETIAAAIAGLDEDLARLVHDRSGFLSRARTSKRREEMIDLLLVGPIESESYLEELAGALRDLDFELELFVGKIAEDNIQEHVTRARQLVVVAASGGLSRWQDRLLRGFLNAGLDHPELGRAVVVQAADSVRPPAAVRFVGRLSPHQTAYETLTELGLAGAEAMTMAVSQRADAVRLFGKDNRQVTVLANRVTRLANELGGAPVDEAFAVVGNSDASLGANHPDTLRARNNLANSYRSAGRIPEAITIQEAVLADFERIFGPDHPDTLRSRNHLANSHQDAGRIAEAITIREAVLVDFERILGADHPDTLRSRNHLANSYQDAGRIAEAITIREAVLADRERILGPDHPDTLRSRSNLANSYQDAGRIAEAITIREAVLADRERILGPDHPDTLYARSNVANSYRSVGRIAEAITIQEAVLVDFERILGPDHPDTLGAHNHLANSYRHAGRIPEAITIQEAVLADRERILGPDHPDTLGARGNLANSYRSVGRIAEAFTIQEAVLADFERILGPSHPDTLRASNNLANSYQYAGRIPEAIIIQEAVLADRERILGPDHPDTLGARGNLANSYQSVGRIAEAITIQEAVLIDFERILGPDHPDTLRASNNLASSCEAIGDVVRAIELLKANVALARSTDRDAQDAQSELARLYLLAGQAEEAITLYREILQIRARQLGEHDPRTREAERWLRSAESPPPSGRSRIGSRRPRPPGPLRARTSAPTTPKPKPKRTT